MYSIHHYRTTLNCGSCVAAARTALDALGATRWSVDLQDPQRVLTVEGEVTPEAVAAGHEAFLTRPETIRLM